MSIPSIISELVEKFELHKDSYTSGIYNEAQLRIEFIDPFFEALGWDINNKQGYAENYKEVIHEDAIKVGGVTKAPDYCFRIGGVRKFFLEAKKPSVDIKEAIHPAYQLRRYAWSAKLPLSILTDFEEFAIYDCRIKPSPADKSSIARTLYLKYSDYINKWDDITNIFSKDAILKGSFDKYVETTKIKKGTAEVDDAFLKEIESWRDILARNIAIRNPQLTQRELNFSVQQTIDRIIFLRICEDRGIENYGRLQALLNGTQIYLRLGELFRMADERYNSGLFYFRKESGRFGSPDELTLNLTIDDNTLKEIIKNLYYPDSPYEFSVLPAYILGYVYEQFLGKVIRLTAGHRAVVEEKPEVRKAGGVYYTPTYIVDYIVKNTVGKLVENKTPNEVEKLRILDPACGSGSFLLGAYQYLLDWHQNWYTKNNPEKWLKGRNPRLVERRKGDFRLTTPERKRILLNNIYGVDIDPQAVEVTKLSLLLKVLEGETEETIIQQLKLFHERALPDLANNIKCGNSLIGPDFYENQQMDLFNEEERYRINAFDWNTEFSEIMKDGGFDAVIGNPPYIRIQGLKEWAPKEVEFYKNYYVSASKGNYDIYVVFVERGLSLLNPNGLLGFILPHKFFNSKYGEPLRTLISKGKQLAEIVYFSAEQVFAGATTYTCLMFLKKTSSKECHIIKVKNISEWLTNGKFQEGIINSDLIKGNEWNFIVGDHSKLFDKINKTNLKLGNIADIFVGLQTSADKVFILNLIKEEEKFLILFSKSLNCECNLEKDLMHPIVSGTDVVRYSMLPNRQYILFTYDINNEKANLILLDKISKLYPKTMEYILKNQKILENREHGKFKNNQWYRLGRSQNLGIQGRIKICIPRLLKKLYATIDSVGTHFLDNVDVGGVSLKNIYKEQSLYFLLGLLNSNLLNWYFSFVGGTFRGGWLSANRQFLSQLPIRIIDFSNKNDKEHYDTVLASVDRMLELNKQLRLSKTEHDKIVINRQIEATDKQIDRLVYELYGLTEEEIETIEKNQ